MENTEPHRYGCHNRKPLESFYLTASGARVESFAYGSPCWYTNTALGQKDESCTGCKWKRTPAERGAR